MRVTQRRDMRDTLIKNRCVATREGRASVRQGKKTVLVHRYGRTVVDQVLAQLCAGYAVSTLRVYIDVYDLHRREES
jgi:hypothetical protein